jgi:hypothetical protein
MSDVMRMERPTQMPPFASICRRLYDEGKSGLFHSGFAAASCPFVSKESAENGNIRALGKV